MCSITFCGLEWEKGGKEAPTVTEGKGRGCHLQKSVS